MLRFDNSGRTYKISELAKELERSVLTIKKWEAEGLIPKAKRDSRNWRYYTEDDIREIRAIADRKGLIQKSPAS